MSTEKRASKLPGDDEIERVKQARAKREEIEEERPSTEEVVKAETLKRRAPAEIKGNDVLLRLHQAGKAGPPPNVPADGGETDLSELVDTAIREFTIQRDDNLPLQFVGYLIGWNDIDPAIPRGTSVCVFVTRRGKIITSVHQWQRDSERERERHDAGVHETAKDALAWLIRDGGDRLGRASREAWDLACQVWPTLQGHEVEVVE